MKRRATALMLIVLLLLMTFETKFMTVEANTENCPNGHEWEWLGGDGNEHGGEFDFDESMHWKVCSFCDETWGHAEHRFVVETVEDDEGNTVSYRKCQCGYMTSAMGAHVHIYDADWTWEGTPLLDGGYSAGYEVRCKICGEVPEDVVEEEPVTVVPLKQVLADCTHDATVTYEASVRVAIDDRDYTFKGTKTVVTMPAVGHEWSDWTVIKAATCEEGGEEKRVCAHDASHIETRNTDPLGHQWVPAGSDEDVEWDWENKTATLHCVCSREKAMNVPEPTTRDITVSYVVITNTATCTASGIERCRAIFMPNGQSLGYGESHEVSALGHDCDEPEWEWNMHDESAPDGVSAELKPVICKRCNQTLAPTVSTSIQKTVVTEVGCETEGETVFTATTSGYGINGSGAIVSYTDEKTVTKPATGHEWSDWTVIKAATCEEGGEEKRVCVHDTSHVETRNTDSLGHLWVPLGSDEDVEWDWENKTATLHCVCSRELEMNVPEPSTRDVTVSYEVDENTAACDAPGTELCRATFWPNGEDGLSFGFGESHEVPSLGHEWSDWTVIKAAICEEGGEEKRVCAHDASHVETRNTDPLGHQWVPAGSGEDVEWDWENKTATLHCVCSREKEMNVPEPSTRDITVSYTTRVTPATCDEPGTEFCRATFRPNGEEGMPFGFNKSHEIPPLGHDCDEPEWEWNFHDESAPEGVSAELKPVICKRCNQTLAPTVSVNVRKTVVTEPGCEAEGEALFTASTLGSGIDDPGALVFYTDEKMAAIPAAGHQWGDWTVTKEATCGEAGEEIRICEKDASHTETRETDPLGHDWIPANMDEPVEWDWENKTATLHCVCSRELQEAEPAVRDITASYETEENLATCTEPGREICAVTFKPNGEEGTSFHFEQAHDSPPLGHDCDEPEWEWNLHDESAPEGVSAELKSVICKRCKETLAPTNPVSIIKKISTEPGCETEGEAVYTASTLGTGSEDSEALIFYTDEKTVAIPAIGHQWGEWSTTKAAACEEAGEETRICAHDSSHRETRAIDSLGHAWGEWTQTRAATCEEAGEEARICAHDSSHRETREIDPLGHQWGDPIWTWNEEKGTATATVICANDPAHRMSQTAVFTTENTATCEAAGVVTHTAAVEMLGKEYTKTTDPMPAEALGHAWGEWSTTKSATCEEAGEETRICARDSSHRETRVTDPLGHQWGDPIWTWNEEKGTATATIICANDADHMLSQTAVYTTENTATCEAAGVVTHTAVVELLGKEYTKTTDPMPIEALGHDWGEWSTTKKATCEEAGEETRICTRDSSHRETRVTDPLGHEWGRWTTVKAAACEKPGKEIRVCTHNSSHTETRETEPLGHVWGKPVWTWRNDEGTVTATLICTHDSSHRISKTKSYQTKTTATCEKGGQLTYSVTMVLAGKEYTKTTGPIHVNALGHKWGPWKRIMEPSGEKEIRVCTRDSSHVEKRNIESPDYHSDEEKITKEAPFTAHVLFKDTGNLQIEDLTYTRDEFSDTYQVTLPAEIPQKNDYYFEGWMCSALDMICKPKDVLEYEYEKHREVTFRPLWTQVLSIGTHKLRKKVRYRLGTGKYQVGKDNTVYAGDQPVYFQEDNEYTITESR